MYTDNGSFRPNLYRVLKSLERAIVEEAKSPAPVDSDLNFLAGLHDAVKNRWAEIAEREAAAA